MKETSEIYKFKQALPLRRQNKDQALYVRTVLPTQKPPCLLGRTRTLVFCQLHALLHVGCMAASCSDLSGETTCHLSERQHHLQCSGCCSCDPHCLFPRPGHILSFRHSQRKIIFYSKSLNLSILYTTSSGIVWTHTSINCYIHEVALFM